MESLQGTKIGGCVTEVSKFISSKNRGVEQKNVYIKQFPSSWKKEDVEKFLKEKFHILGKVESEAIGSKEIEGETKYFAFIAF